MTLKEYKEKNNLTFKQLAELIGVKGTNVAVNSMRWINGTRIPSPKWMRKITEKTGVTPNEIYRAYYEINKL